MPPAVRLGDIASGHGSFPPTKTIEGSGNTVVNSIPVHRNGDAIASHSSPSPSPPHKRAAACSSGNTFVNSKGVVRIGDCVSCGGMLVTGSGNTLIN